MSNLLTIGVKDAASLLGISHWTLRQYIKQRRLGAVRIGRRLLLEPTELGHFVQRCRSEKAGAQ